MGGESKRRKQLNLAPRRKKTMVKCRDCEYWKKQEKAVSEVGNCVRHPPVPMLIPMQGPMLEVAGSIDLGKVNQPKMSVGMNFFFPMTVPDIECGDGIPRKP